MSATWALFSFAAVGAVVASEVNQPNVNTATGTAAVYQAQATAVTYEGRTNPYKPDPNLAWLASKGITLSNYFGVTHPSEPNYVASIGGDHFGINDDSFIQISDNASSVIDLLEDKGISWGSYQEDMPYTGYEGFSWVNQQTKANDYVRKHNPPVIFNKNTSPRRLSYQKNLTRFYDDLKNERLPQWSFITPNMTSDGHDSSVTTAGAWSRNFLEPLLSNKYFMERTLVLLTFDENHTYTIGNRVFGILLGGAVPSNLHGTIDDQYYNHYSDISTVEANWNLHTLGRWDVGANVFKLVAEQTGDIYRPDNAVTSSSPSQFLNASYAGPLSSNNKAPYPIPNTQAKSPKTQRSVLPSIVELYSSLQKSVNAYYDNGVKIPDGQHPPKGY